MKEGKEDQLKAELNEIGTYLVGLGSQNTSGDPIPHQVLNARYHEQKPTSSPKPASLVR